MKHTYFSLLILLFFGGMSYAEGVYQCPSKNGKVEYTSSFRPGCVDAKLKKIESYTPVLGNSSYHSTSNDVAPPADNNAVFNAQKDFFAAERALAEGQAVRYGNERNYVKKQERIQKLEEDVARARENLQNIQDSNIPR